MWNNFKMLGPLCVTYCKLIRHASSYNELMLYPCCRDVHCYYKACPFFRSFNFRPEIANFVLCTGVSVLWNLRINAVPETAPFGEIESLHCTNYRWFHHYYAIWTGGRGTRPKIKIYGPPAGRPSTVWFFKLTCRVPEYSSFFQTVLPGGRVQFGFSNCPAGRPSPIDKPAEADRSGDRTRLP